MKEKNKIRLHRLSWLVILLLSITIPLIIFSNRPELDIVDYDGYIDYYYESLNETSLDIEIEFNRKINSGYATIDYYDADHKFLERKESYFTVFSSTVAHNSYITVKGKVCYLEIVSFDFETDDLDSYFIWYSCMIIPVAFFIASLLLSYKEYYYNGKTISVYAGWFHHTLRIDGEKYDEHNTLMSWTPLYLSTTLSDGTVIDATISLTNRIALKVNDRLLK